MQNIQWHVQHDQCLLLLLGQGRKIYIEIQLPSGAVYFSFQSHPLKCRLPYFVVQSS